MNKVFTGAFGAAVLVCVLLLGGCGRLPWNAKEMLAEPLKFRETLPWGAYQKATYIVYKGETESGTAEIEVTKSADGDTYTIQKVKKTNAQETRGSAVLHADTLMPVESDYGKQSDKEAFSVHTSYGEQWTWSLQNDGEEQTLEREIDLPAYYYDNESLMVILGALSREGTDTFRLNDAVPLTAKIESLQGKYEGKEQIAVPYGEADCDKLSLGDLTFWYSGDGGVLYQYQDGDLIYRLTDLTHDQAR